MTSWNLDRRSVRADGDPEGLPSRGPSLQGWDSGPDSCSVSATELVGSTPVVGRILRLPGLFDGFKAKLNDFRRLLLINFPSLAKRRLPSYSVACILMCQIYSLETIFH